MTTTEGLQSTRKGPAPYRTIDEALAIARDLQPRLRERVWEADRLRRLPDENVAALVDSRLLDLVSPSCWGGAELNTDALIEVTAVLAEGCSSTGWVYALWVAHVWFVTHLPLDVQEMILGDRKPTVSSIVNTQGVVKRVDGGFLMNVKGSFSSGVNHCQWLLVRIEVDLEEGNPPERCWFLVPRSQFTIQDDWHTVGLRGTGSNAVTVEDVFVPAHHVINVNKMFSEPGIGARHFGLPLYNATGEIVTRLSTAAPELGIARGILHAFEERCRQRADSQMPLHLQTNGLMRFSQAAAEIDSAFALLVAHARNYCSIPSSETAPIDVARCRRDVAYAAQLCRGAANSMFEASGSGSVYEDKDMSRRWRDSNVASAHAALLWDVHGLNYGYAAVGLPTIA